MGPLPPWGPRGPWFRAAVGGCLDSPPYLCLVVNDWFPTLTRQVPGSVSVSPTPLWRPRSSAPAARVRWPASPLLPRRLLGGLHPGPRPGGPAQRSAGGPLSEPGGLLPLPPPCPPGWRLGSRQWAFWLAAWFAVLKQRPVRIQLPPPTLSHDLPYISIPIKKKLECQSAEQQRTIFRYSQRLYFTLTLNFMVPSFSHELQCISRSEHKFWRRIPGFMPGSLFRECRREEVICRPNFEELRPPLTQH